MADDAELPRPSPYRWPSGWKQMHPWRNLAHTMVGIHGLERTREIALGRDPTTNADLESWRRIGR